MLYFILMLIELTVEIEVICDKRVVDISVTRGGPPN